jgi:hypothetical protein
MHNARQNNTKSTISSIVVDPNMATENSTRKLPTHELHLNLALNPNEI